MRLRLLGLLVGLLGFVSALSAQGNELLVVIEDEEEKGKYTQFWSDLQERGFQLTYLSPKDTTLSLFQHDVPAYTHLLLLPTKSKGLGPSLTPQLIVDFVNAGSNVLLALSSTSGTPSAISALLAELDIALPAERNSLVVDHFNHDSISAPETHDVLLLPSPGDKPGVKPFFAVPGLIAFPRAVGQVLGAASPLLAPILAAPRTAYAYNPKDDSGEALDDLFASGAQLALASAFQARNSARFTVLGSAEALTDEWFTASVSLPTNSVTKAGGAKTPTANRAFARQLTAWAFKEAGVLRVEGIAHFLNEPPTGAYTFELNPPIYRIKNHVYYSAALSEWDGTRWTPFVPPAGDAVQLEFSMLSPFHRLNLNASSGNPTATEFTAEFDLPDQHGIFNFMLEYRRPFLTVVEEKRTVTVRHFAHDEWPRSFVITGAYPWISGIGVTVVGWVGFVALWLYSKPGKPQRDLKVGGKR
ncbi:oligosaccharyl transferase glycoprotein complex, beta subunit [Teratosphaeriaceae sp. CCFEE 6253]|nr:oligosaccharyl transferase glycoprotein complex, beta subunit [Teratosphaeriaceae sp. CCFEE 6253]